MSGARASTGGLPVCVFVQLYPCVLYPRHEVALCTLLLAAWYPLHSSRDIEMFSLPHQFRERHFHPSLRATKIRRCAVWVCISPAGCRATLRPWRLPLGALDHEAWVKSSLADEGHSLFASQVMPHPLKLRSRTGESRKTFIFTFTPCRMSNPNYPCFELCWAV